MSTKEDFFDMNASTGSQTSKIHLDISQSEKPATVLPTGGDTSINESSEVHSIPNPFQIASALASLPIQIVPVSTCDGVVAEKKGRFSVIAETSSNLSIVGQSECRNLQNYEPLEPSEKQSLNVNIPTGVASIPVQIVPANSVDTVVAEKKGRFSIISSRATSSPVSFDSPQQEEAAIFFENSLNHKAVPIASQQTHGSLHSDSENIRKVNGTGVQHNLSTSQPNPGLCSSSPGPAPSVDYQTPPNPTSKTIHLQIPISPARTIQGHSVFNVNQNSLQQHQPQSLQQAIPLNLRKGRFIVSNTGHNRANSAGSLPSDHSQPIFPSGSIPIPQHLPRPANAHPSISPQITTVQASSNSAQGSSNPPLAPLTIAVERINSSVNTSSSGKGGLSSAIPGGIGKMFHFLDQLRLEITEADKMIKALQTDVKYLRGKNKELEYRCHDLEKQIVEERASKEDLELKLRNMKRRLKEIKDTQNTQDLILGNENERHVVNQAFQVSPIFSDTNSPIIGLNCMLDFPTGEPPTSTGDSTNSAIDAIVESLSPIDLNQ